MEWQVGRGSSWGIKGVRMQSLGLQGGIHLAWPSRHLQALVPVAAINKHLHPDLSAARINPR